MARQPFCWTLALSLWFLSAMTTASMPPLRAMATAFSAVDRVRLWCACEIRADHVMNGARKCVIYVYCQMYTPLLYARLARATQPSCWTPEWSAWLLSAYKIALMPPARAMETLVSAEDGGVSGEANKDTKQPSRPQTAPFQLTIASEVAQHAAASLLDTRARRMAGESADYGLDSATAGNGTAIVG
jgi:hypothetical protein